MKEFFFWFVGFIITIMIEIYAPDILAISLGGITQTGPEFRSTVEGQC